MKFIKLFCVLMSVQILIGCHSKSNSILVSADLIIESDPHNAYSLLKSINPSDLNDDDLAYFALLLTQAKIKCDEDIKSDSLIRIAFDAYKNQDDIDKKIRSEFYEAYILYNNSFYYDATKLALSANELARCTGNNYWTAKSAELLSDIFFRSRNYSEAKYYNIETLTNYKKAGKHENVKYSVCDLAICNLNLNENESAYLLLDSIWNATNGENNPDYNLMTYIRLPLIEAKTKTGRYDSISKSDLIFLNSIESGPEPRSSGATIIKSRIVMHNNPDSLKYDVHKLLQLQINSDDKTNLLYDCYIKAKYAEDYQGALALVDSLLYHQNQVAEKIIKESAVSAQRDYYSEEATENNRKANNLRFTLISSFAVFVIIAALVGWIYQIKSRNYKKELEESAASVIELKYKADRLQNDYRYLENLAEQNAEVIAHLFQDKWSVLNILCNEYFNIGESDASKKSVLNSIDKEMKKLRSKDYLNEIVSAVDLYMGGVVTTLKAECKFLKEDDIIFLSLLFAGFSVRAVCLFTGVAYKSFYVKKSRLTGRISKTDFPQKDRILSLLS